MPTFALQYEATYSASIYIYIYILHWYLQDIDTSKYIPYFIHLKWWFLWGDAPRYVYKSTFKTPKCLFISYRLQHPVGFLESLPDRPHAIFWEPICRWYHLFLAKPAGQVEFSRFLKWKKDWKKHHWCRDAFLWFSIMYRTARSGRLRTRISQRYAWIFWRMITNYENHAVLVSCHSDRHKNVSCTQGEEISKDIYGSMTCKTWPLTGLPIAPLVFWELVHQLFGLPQSSDG